MRTKIVPISPITWQSAPITNETKNRSQVDRIDGSQMGVCEQCMAAIHQLQHWPDLPQSRKQVSLTMPSRDHLKRLDCFICKKFCDWLRGEDEQAYEEWHEHTLEVRYSGVMRVLGQDDKTLFPFVILICPSDYEGGGCLVELNFILAHGRYCSPVAESSASLFCTDVISAHQEPQSYRFRSSEADLRAIKKWYDRCISEHKKCGETQNDWYPTRLLHIGLKGRYMRLILTGEGAPAGPYVTLSHRWNHHPYVKLQSSTIKQLQSRIDIFSLPKSFQDAVRIARSLSLNYLWIDALCIKQDPDDLSDWREESKRMGQVYSNAALNVSATRSTDGFDPLLGRSAWMSKLPTETTLQVEGQSQMCFVVDGNLWADEVDQGPLLGRGWVFQERFLARRIIHFGESQLAWECCELCALDMFPEELPSSLGLPLQKDPVLSHSDHDKAQESSSSKIPDLGFAERWQQLVRQYSKCQLTRSTDKLIALQGIVWHESQFRLTDNYASGMWKSTALYDLPWWRHEEDREQYRLEDTRERAPSWSWASVDGEIVLPLSFGVLSPVEDHFAQVTELTDHTFGLDGCVIQRGIMKLRGLCVKVQLQSSDGEIQGFTIAELDFLLGEGLRASSMYLESPTEVAIALSESKCLFLLPLFTTRHTLFCLVVHPIQEKDTYHRLGAVEIPVMTLAIPNEKDRVNEQLSISSEPISTSSLNTVRQNMLDVWDKPAITLIHQLRRHQLSSRTIIIK